MLNQPKRVLRTFDATAMVIGNMIGSGIFLLSGYAAEPVSGGWALILAWVFGGMMALFGALAIAELSTRFPHTGGDFLYLHKLYGTYPAFLYGWMSLVISETGSIALLALFSAKYAIQIFPDLVALNLSEQIIGSVIIGFFTLLHCIRVTVGARFQSILTVMKVMGIALLAYLLFGGDVSSVSANYAKIEIENPVRGFSRALVPIFWTFTGWNVAGYVAGEIKNPRKTLPIALIGGTGITILIYLLLNGAFLKVLSLDGMRGDSMVPMTALKSIDAGQWILFLTILIFVSVVSSLSIAVQSGARIVKSMGEQGVFFKLTSSLHPRFGTPVIALTIQGIWSIVLIHILNIENLVYSTTVVMILFSGLTISTLLKAKKKRNNEKKVTRMDYYNTPFFPLIPIVYIASVVFIAWGVVRFYLSQGSYLPFWGFGFLLVGSVIYLIWKKQMYTLSYRGNH